MKFFAFKSLTQTLLIGAFAPILVVAFQNCGASHDSDMGSASQSLMLEEQQQKAMNLLDQRCAECHTSGAENTELTKILDPDHLTDNGFIVPGAPQESPLYLDVLDGIEPRGENAPLSMEDVNILRDWIAMLGGNFDTIIADEDGVIDEPSDPPTYDEIDTILQARCVNCHGGGNGRSDLSNYQGVQQVVTPGDASSSPLYTEVVSGNMPQGGPPLSGEEISAIAYWINNGAENN